MEINNHVTSQSVVLQLQLNCFHFSQLFCFFSLLWKTPSGLVVDLHATALHLEKEVNYNLFRAFQRRKSCLFDSWVLLTLHPSPFFLIKTFLSLSLFSVLFSVILRMILPSLQWRQRVPVKREDKRSQEKKSILIFVFNISTWLNLHLT